MSLVQRVVECVSECSQDEEQRNKPGICIACLTASLCVRKRRKACSVLFSLGQLLLAEMESTLDVLHLFLESLSDEVSLNQLVNTILREQNPHNLQIAASWTSATDDVAVTPQQEAELLQACNKIFEEVDFSLRSFVEAERDSWQMFLLFRGSSYEKSPLIHLIREWIQLLDYNMLKLELQIQQDDEDEQQEQAGPQVPRAALPLQDNLRILVALDDDDCVRACTDVLSDDPLPGTTVDGTIIEHARKFVQDTQGMQINMNMSYGIKHVALIAGGDEFWKKQCAKTLWKANGNSLSAPYKVLALARNVSTDEIFMCVVWKSIVCVGPGNPLGCNFWKKSSKNLAEFQLSATNVFSPRRMDTVHCKIPAAGQYQTKMECSRSVQGFPKLVFKSEWVQMDFRRMTMDILFLVRGLLIEKGVQGAFVGKLVLRKNTTNLKNYPSEFLGGVIFRHNAARKRCEAMYEDASTMEHNEEAFQLNADGRRVSSHDQLLLFENAEVYLQSRKQVSARSFALEFQSGNPRALDKKLLRELFEYTQEEQDAYFEEWKLHYHFD